MKSSFARVIPFAVSASLALLLAACGGGDGTSAGSASVPPADNVAGNSPAVAGLDVSEFLGTWYRVDSASCFGGVNGGFAYGPYYFKNDSFVLTSTTATLTETIYTDAACTMKAGVLVENYAVVFSASSLAGKSNVVRFQVSYTASNSSADGGSGLSFSKMPDGSQTGGNAGTSRGLFTVMNAQLYGSTKASALDADGYPTQLSTTPLYQR